MTTEYTVTFRLNKPDFQSDPWSDALNTNFDAIDSIMSTIFNLLNSGPWANNRQYHINDLAVDLSTIPPVTYVCLVSHVSASSPTTFAQDRVAHPTFWTTNLPFGTTVANLPPANAANKFQRNFVSDATLSIFNSQVIGGGVLVVPVFSDGVVWRIG